MESVERAEQERQAREHVTGRLEELRALGVERGMGRERLRVALGRDRSMPVILEAADLEAIQPGLTGLYIEAGSTIVLLYPEGEDEEYQDHAIYHEAGHAFMRHRPLRLYRIGTRLQHAALGRDGYSRIEEFEAEYFATQLGGRAEGQGRGDTDEGGLRSRITSLLEG